MSMVFKEMFPAIMVMWIFIIAQQPMADLFTEIERKTLSRLLSTTVTIQDFLISKIIRCFLLCMISIWLLVLVSSLLFGVSWGNLFWLFMLIAAASLAITGFVSIIYSISPKKEVANAIAPFLILTSSFLGGSMIPYNQLPPFIKNLGMFTVNRWGILGLQNVMNAKPLDEILYPLGILFVFGIASSCLAFYLFKKRFEAGKMK